MYLIKRHQKLIDWSHSLEWKKKSTKKRCSNSILTLMISLKRKMQKIRLNLSIESLATWRLPSTTQSESQILKVVPSNNNLWQTTRISRSVRHQHLLMATSSLWIRHQLGSEKSRWSSWDMMFQDRAQRRQSMVLRRLMMRINLSLTLLHTTKICRRINLETVLLVHSRTIRSHNNLCSE